MRQKFFTVPPRKDWQVSLHPFNLENSTTNTTTIIGKEKFLNCSEAKAERLATRWADKETNTQRSLDLPAILQSSWKDSEWIDAPPNSLLKGAFKVNEAKTMLLLLSPASPPIN